ncbi:hypothetical protein [Thiohalophilus sp.]|uniref:hypothetical protein n=1 Tax=Thiohalophilus sp. TaxID=3028392 RepID=UPI002ACDC047|nr:hypothetical protein [Thiohalophilus sp.]MDZ7802383.1 hypothetical protein [Thiohalophilus sp.]
MEQPIDKEKLKAYISEELENVLKLKKQLTDEQIDKLEEEFDKKEIHDTLLEMENYNGLSKKYVSVYLTLRNWIKLKRKKTGGGSGGFNRATKGDDHADYLLN